MTTGGVHDKDEEGRHWSDQLGHTLEPRSSHAAHRSAPGFTRGFLPLPLPTVRKRLGRLRQATLRWSRAFPQLPGTLPHPWRSLIASRVGDYEPSVLSSVNHDDSCPCKELEGWGTPVVGCQLTRTTHGARRGRQPPQEIAGGRLSASLGGYSEETPCPHLRANSMRSFSAPGRRG